MNRWKPEEGWSVIGKLPKNIFPWRPKGGWGAIGKPPIIAILINILLFISIASADLPWQETTPGQQMLRSYIEQVNLFLTEAGETPVNSLFEEYEKVASLGITAFDQAQEPEGVEISASMFHDSLNQVILRVRQPERFARIAGAFLCALTPEMTLAEAMKTPSEKANRALREPANSFEDEVETLNGERPRVYYAYYPNQYHDGFSWLQMTIIFPLSGTWDGAGYWTAVQTTKAPDTWSGADRQYEGYSSKDDYQHFEIFATATPEPDSAAADELRRME